MDELESALPERLGSVRLNAGRKRRNGRRAVACGSRDRTRPPSLGPFDQMSPPMAQLGEDLAGAQMPGRVQVAANTGEH